MLYKNLELLRQSATKKSGISFNVIQKHYTEIDISDIESYIDKVPKEVIYYAGKGYERKVKDLDEVIKLVKVTLSSNICNDGYFAIVLEDNSVIALKINLHENNAFASFL